MESKRGDLEGLRLLAAIRDRSGVEFREGVKGSEFSFDPRASSKRDRIKDVMAIEDCQWNPTGDVRPQIACGRRQSQVDKVVAIRKTTMEVKFRHATGIGQPWRIKVLQPLGRSSRILQDEDGSHRNSFRPRTNPVAHFEESIETIPAGKAARNTSLVARDAEDGRRKIRIPAEPVKRGGGIRGASRGRDRVPDHRPAVARSGGSLRGPGCP